MLKVSIHAGLLAELQPESCVGVLDIAYRKRHALADYAVAMQLAGVGEMPPATVSAYPRWSGSLWDLVARAITQVLYQSDVAPPAPKVDKRCAYTKKLCAVIHSATLEGPGRRLATFEIQQSGRVRGEYRAVFWEDILGEREASFEYGTKNLNFGDLMLRAICHSLWQRDTLGPKPSLILPGVLKLDGEEDTFQLEALPEPALTGFKRYCATKEPKAAIDALPPAKAFTRFLMGN